MNGSIDWYCFDSPSIFGAILDDEKGCRFQISADRRESCREASLGEVHAGSQTKDAKQENPGKTQRQRLAQ